MNDDDGRDVPAGLEMQQPGPCGDSRVTLPTRHVRSPASAGLRRGYVGVARDWTEEGASSFPNLLFVVPGPAREQAIVSALEQALARFKKSRKIDALPFFVTSERHLAESGVLGRSGAHFVRSWRGAF